MSRTMVYIGSNTDASDNESGGLTVFDVDTEKASLTKKSEYPVRNATYIAVSYDRRFLYSTTDLGVIAFRILPDGDLERLNIGFIRGMRGGHICLNRDNTYMFVSGYHDGKITVLRILPDGSVGEVTDGIFHKGPGSIAERTMRPHVRCSGLTPDEKFLIVQDSGIDQAKIYAFNKEKGTLRNVDAIHFRKQAGPRYMCFSRDGRYFYFVKEILNAISVYEYMPGERVPGYRLIQTVSTLGKKHSDFSAAVTCQFTKDERHVVCTNSGDNSLAIFDRDPDTGLLTQRRVLPISGGYPTSVNFFPDEKHLFCTNYDSGTVNFFSIDFEKALLLMYRSPVSVPAPYCSRIVELPE